MADKEVRAKLVLDDQATSALQKIKSAFMSTDESATKAQSSAGFVKQTLSTLAAVNLVPLVRSVADFAKGFVDASAGVQDLAQSITGFSMVAQDIGYDDAYAAASRLTGELADMGIAAGQSIDDVRGAFRTLVMYSGATEEGISRAKDQVSKMTTVANVLGISTQDLARQWGMMSEGQLPRMTSELRQLLQPTGIFNSDITKATTEWAKLTDEQRLKAMTYGLDEMSSKLAKAKPTFHDLSTAAGNIWQVMKERLGEPIMKALVPEMKELVPVLKDLQGEIESLAKDATKDMKQWIRDGFQAFKDGAQYLKTHHEEIKDMIVGAAHVLKSTVDFILAHKTELAVALGARAAAPIVAPVAGAAKNIYGLGSAGTSVGGAGLTGAAGGVAALAAFTAAVIGAGLAVDQFAKLMDETEGGKSEASRDQGARQRAIKQMIDTPDLGPWTKEQEEWFSHLREQYVETARAEGENSRAAGDYVDKAWEAHRAARAQVQQFDDMARVLQQLQATGGVEGLDLGPMVSKISEGFMAAQQTGNTAVAQYIASMLANSTTLHSAFLNSANLTGEGFIALAEMIGTQAQGFAEKLKNLGAAETKAAGGKAPAPQIHMSGGQTFKIQQDFRDQDPDRVAVSFRRDIARSVTSRLQSRTSSPFGT